MEEERTAVVDAVAAAAAAVPSTSFTLTAFGPFHEVPLNPTQVLLERLSSHLEASPLPPGALLSASHVVPVSAASARALRLSASAPPADSETESRVRRVLLHLGVHGTSEEFRLESRACNEATFRVADVDGVQLTGERVVDECEAGCWLESSLSCTTLAATLRERGVAAVESDDAGRYLCNFIYFLSLYRLKEAGFDACLFLHCPKEEFMCIEKQLEGVAALMQPSRSCQLGEGARIWLCEVGGVRASLSRHHFLAACYIARFNSQVAFSVFPCHNCFLARVHEASSRQQPTTVSAVVRSLTAPRRARSPPRRNPLTPSARAALSFTGGLRLLVLPLVRTSGGTSVLCRLPSRLPPPFCHHHGLALLRSAPAERRGRQL